MRRALVLLVLAACEPNLGDTVGTGVLQGVTQGKGVVASGPADAASCPDVPMQVFTVSCATGGCHSSVSPQAGLDLSGSDVIARLDGKADSHGGLLLDPSAPAKSTVYQKLLSPPPFGSQMPLGGPYLDAATAACVLTWIQTGITTSAGGTAPDAGAGAPPGASLDAGPPTVATPDAAPLPPPPPLAEDASNCPTLPNTAPVVTSNVSTSLTFGMGNGGKHPDGTYFLSSVTYGAQPEAGSAESWKATLQLSGLPSGGGSCNGCMQSFQWSWQGPGAPAVSGGSVLESYTGDGNSLSFTGTCPATGNDTWRFNADGTNIWLLDVDYWCVFQFVKQ